MNVEAEIKRLTEGLLNDPTPPVRYLGINQLGAPAPTRPTGGTVLEALEKLQTHAAHILKEAADLEIALIGNTGTANADSFASDVPEVGIWDRLAAKVVLIERTFAQIDAAHQRATESLK
jgi:hypothetical protein